MLVLIVKTKKYGLIFKMISISILLSACKSSFFIDIFVLVSSIPGQIFQFVRSLKMIS